MPLTDHRLRDFLVVGGCGVVGAVVWRWLQRRRSRQLLLSTQVAAGVPQVIRQPLGFEWLDGEPVFDPAVDLQLEMPASVTTLAQLGYDEAEVRNKATAFAVSAPFRVLSKRGAQTMLEVSRRLKQFAYYNQRNTSTRGGAFRSRWLRDLCTCPELTAHLSAIYGVEVAPHPMALQLGHLNYQPRELGKAIDKWHSDTLPLDFVMMVTDPATLRGGQFEWFMGTKAEAAELRSRGLTPSDVGERVRQPEFPAAGYAIALHGDMVVHRGAPLECQGERITMVNGYVATDTARDDQCRCKDLMVVDPPAVLFAEWARFAAWRSASKLRHIIDSIEFGTAAADVAAQLEDAIADARQAAAQMRSGPPETAEHYELSATATQ